ncbi:MAG: alpha amylase N-terminal ig-like domain-containing protein [Thermococcus sp.]|nr:alpha amylase N-terminal ig-like domain-containing protein [Thermococcus sp.]
MYKTFGFTEDALFGRVAKVEFSIPYRGEKYAYLLGSFNAFNEGSFRMKKRDGQWCIKVELPEGVWHYAFSLEGKFALDPENPHHETYRRPSYKFERETNVAVIKGPGKLFHRPSATYLYSFAGRTHILLRADHGLVEKATVVLGNESLAMRRKAIDELFEYFEAVLPEKSEIEYHFEIRRKDGGVEILGPFNAKPYELEAPEWVFSRVFYQIMPDRFEKGFPEEPKGEAFRGEQFHGGDLVGIIKRLRHLKEIGVNALYLTPIFESMTYHRYDITDYFHVDRKLGGDEVFSKLVQELKKRDIRLIIDGVFHHTSFFHPYFQDVVQNGENSRYRDFYRVTGFPVVPKEFLDVLNSDLPWTEKYRKLREFKWNYESFFSVWAMSRLNHENPEVVDFVREVMRYWLERGADGWRLDVAHGVPPGLWRKVRKALPKDAYLVGEVMDDARLWLFDAFHGTMNYPLYDLILRFFVRNEITAEEFLNGLELLSAYLGPAEYAMYNFLDNHDTERFLDLVGDKRKYLCALAFLMTYKGIPSIFYGDEIGLRGQLDGSLSAGRTPMVWNPEEWDTEILETTKRLIELRRRSKALQLGEFVPVKFKGRTMVYERVFGDERVRVEIKYSEKPKDCTFQVRVL